MVNRTIKKGTENEKKEDEMNAFRNNEDDEVFCRWRQQITARRPPDPILRRVGRRVESSER